MNTATNTITLSIEQVDAQLKPVINQMVSNLPENYPFNEGIRDNSNAPGLFKSPREAIRTILKNISKVSFSDFNGLEAASKMAEDTSDFTYALNKNILSGNIINEIGGVQPVDENKKIFHLNTYPHENAPNTLRFCVSETDIVKTTTKMQQANIGSWGLLNSINRELSIDWNCKVLKSLDSLAKSYANFEQLNNSMLEKMLGSVTHLLIGEEAFNRVAKTIEVGKCIDKNSYYGLEYYGISPSLNCKVFKVKLWNGKDSNKILGLHRGKDWLDTPIVWSPIISYPTPEYQDGDAICQDIISYAGLKCVNTDSIGLLETI